MNVNPITVCVRNREDDASRLRDCLSCVLAQRYDTFEVLVVLRPKDEECINMLKRMEIENLNLRHVVTPAASRFIPEEQLMLSLGIMSARYDWVVMTQSACTMDAYWLHAMADTGAYDVLVGATVSPQMDMGHVWRQMTDLYLTARGHRVYHADPCNMAVRKNTFMSSGGFAPYSAQVEGVAALYANHCDRVGAARSCVTRPATTDVEAIWWMETRRHLVGKLVYRATFAFDNLCSQLLFWVSAALIAHAAIVVPENHAYMIAGTLLVYALYVVMEMVLFNRRAQQVYGRTMGVMVSVRKLLFPVSWLFTLADYIFMPRRRFYKRLVD